MNGSAPLSVALLHNYRDDQQPSMRLYAERLGDALCRQGVRLTRLRPPGVVPDAWRVRSPAFAKLDAYAGRFLVYPRLIRALQADVAHVIDHGQGYLVAGLDSARTVVTCHDVILLALAAGRIGGSTVPQVALQLFRMSLELMRKAALVVAVSQQTKNDLVTFLHMDPNRIRVIPPGLNQSFRPDRAAGVALRERLGLGDGPLVFQVGRAFYKNITGVLRVVNGLRRGGLDVRLVRVGRALAGEERALADRLGVTNHVIELGGIPDEQMPALYNAVDLLLFPSLYEGFGWPPLEAMASGTPVVASRSGSLLEVLGDAALTADPEDIEALTWHAASVLTDATLRSQLVERGLRHSAQFTWERTAAAMVDVYHDVLNRAA